VSQLSSLNSISSCKRRPHFSSCAASKRWKTERNFLHQ